MLHKVDILSDSNKNIYWSVVRSRHAPERAGCPQGKKISTIQQILRRPRVDSETASSLVIGGNFREGSGSVDTCIFIAPRLTRDERVKRLILVCAILKLYLL